jgi:hypothetical protein
MAQTQGFIVKRVREASHGDRNALSSDLVTPLMTDRQAAYCN